MATNVAKRRICVLQCPPGVPIHKVPKDEISRNVWLKKLGIKYTSNKDIAVCDRHFSRKMRPPGKGIHLNPWAIPDMNLPEIIELSDSSEEEEGVEMFSQEDTMDVPEDHTNGYVDEDSVNSSEEVRPDSSQNAEEVDEMDFDVLLAKVHCISDITKEKQQSSVSVQCTEYDDFDDDDDYDQFPRQRRAADMTMENSYFVNEDKLSAPNLPDNITTKFKRKLIASVKKRRILYDPAHPSFSNIEKKTRTWERIGKIFKMEGSACRELWLNMRYDYQVHVRSLRQWLAGESNLRARPHILMENELLFLWRFIAEKSYYDGSDDEEMHLNTDALEEPACNGTLDVSNEYAYSVDHPYANNQPNESDVFACKVIDAVKPYSELYDNLHPNYGDPKRKSIIWDAISNELRERATKCLFTWIQLILRYEFEIVHKKQSFVVQKLDFIHKHVLPNEKSPFKKMKSLLSCHKWHDPLPMRYQISLVQTLGTSKKFRPFLMCIDAPPTAGTNVLVPCWSAIGRNLRHTPEECEITWVLIQAMFIEISEMRNSNFPLRDEWELEAIINKFRSTVTKSNKRLKALPKGNKSAVAKNATEANTTETNTIQDPTPPTPPPTATPPTTTPPSTPPPPPEPPLSNELTFTIPVITEGGVVMQQIVQFKLNTPIEKLPEKSILDINTVLPNAHIVIMTEPQQQPVVYLFTYEKRMELIAEVMIRPIVFNDPYKTTRQATVFWGDISMVTEHPVDICMCFWDYIVEKLFFLDYDPAYLKSEGPKWLPPPTPIFEKFQKFADMKKWGEVVSILPDFMQEVGHFPLVYSDQKTCPTWNRRQCYLRDCSAIWALISRKFPTLENPKTTWERFKKLFCLYMSEMEVSIYHTWPSLWAPVLAKMTFLLDLRYVPKDPIYHIIKQKCKDEIAECQREHPVPPVLDSYNNFRAIFQAHKDDYYIDRFRWVNRGRFLAKLKMYPVLYNVSHPLFGDKDTKQEAWQEIAVAFQCTVIECHMIFQHLMRKYLLFRARDPHQLCHVNAKYWDNMTYIYSCAMPNTADSKLLEGRTFRAELNGSTIKLAEEFQMEISMIDATPRLVLKNFGAAVSSLPDQIQGNLIQRLKCIFNKYARIQSEEIVVDV